MAVRLIRECRRINSISQSNADCMTFSVFSKGRMKREGCFRKHEAATNQIGGKMLVVSFLMPDAARLAGTSLSVPRAYVDHTPYVSSRAPIFCTAPRSPSDFCIYNQPNLLMPLRTRHLVCSTRFIMPFAAPLLPQSRRLIQGRGRSTCEAMKRLRGKNGLSGKNPVGASHH